jgi:solute carrier family 20 (sodium-dependent phosphate transporter)
VTDYYKSPYETESDSGSSENIPQTATDTQKNTADSSALEKGPHNNGNGDALVVRQRKRALEPEERFLRPNDHLSLFHPQRLWGYTKYILLQGVTRDCVSHANEALRE